MIAALAGQGYDVKRCCRILGVAPSGYFGWRHRPPSAMELRREWLRGLISQIHAESASFLSERFTVYIYDRRGRHESGDSAGSATHALERETEDLDAVVAEAGGTADVFGHPSGAVIALEAARARVGVTRLALYEAPLWSTQPASDLSGSGWRARSVPGRPQRRSKARPGRRPSRSRSRRCRGLLRRNCN